VYEFRERDAHDFARHIRARVKLHGDELRFTGFCPYCNGGDRRDKDTFSINLKTGQYKCLRSSCSATGNMLTLSRDFDFSLGVQIDEYYQPRRQFKKLKTPAEPVKPKEPAVRYLESRGISQAVAERYEITVRNDDDNVLVFPFYDDRGFLQFVKYRKTDFDKDKDKNKEWCEEGCKPILFGMKQCDANISTLVITEGQIDSLSVVEGGFTNAISVPTGAKGFTWVPYCWDWVRQFEEIIVFGDMENGKMTLLDDIQKRFPNLIKHVREEDYQGCKDANELLVNHGASAVRQAVEKAIPIPVNRVVELADVENVDIYKLEKLSSSIYQVDRLLYGGLPFGGVVLVSGKPGEGKSTLASQILAIAIDAGHKTFAYSGELPNYQFKAWMDFQIAGPAHVIEQDNKFGDKYRSISKTNKQLIGEWYRGKAFMYDNRIVEADEKEDIIKTATDVIMQYGVRVILIDNLMTAIDLDVTHYADKYEKQSIFMKKLARIALRYDVLILLVAHKRKNNFSTNENDEVSGAGDITNLATVTISYGKDSELSSSQRRLRVSKNRLFGKINTAGYVLDYDERSKRIYGIQDDVNKQLGWDKSDGFVDVENLEIPFN